MLICIEGNEVNFKSTVVNKLAEKLNYKIVKGSSFEQSTCTQEELFNKFMEFAQLDNVILDRFYPSNLVYADLYADFSIINREQQLEIERVLKERNALMVYLFADTGTLEQRLTERGDDYVEVGRLGEINKKYEEVMGTVNLPYIAIDTKERELHIKQNLKMSDAIVNGIMNLVTHIQQEGAQPDESGTS